MLVVKAITVPTCFGQSVRYLVEKREGYRVCVVDFPALDHRAAIGHEGCHGRSWFERAEILHTAWSAPVRLARTTSPSSPDGGAGEPKSEAAIDAALEESFPASDPPPWTLGVISQEAEMKVRCRTVDSLLAEVEGVQRHVAQRALEIFRARGSGVGSALEDWMKAERETIWRPALEVRRTKDTFVVEAAVAGVDPKQFDVQVTPTELLLGAHVHHSDREQEGEIVLCEFANGPLFRSYKFPEPVDPARVSADYRNGMLRVTAPLAQLATKVEIQAT